MLETKSIINYCVKCKSKFTSAQRPLKLLPCLHSMCLDCLYGRPPARRSSRSSSCGAAIHSPSAPDTTITITATTSTTTVIAQAHENNGEEAKNRISESEFTTDNTNGIEHDKACPQKRQERKNSNTTAESCDENRRNSPPLSNRNSENSDRDVPESEPNSRDSEEVFENQPPKDSTSKCSEADVPDGSAQAQVEKKASSEKDTPTSTTQSSSPEPELKGINAAHIKADPDEVKSAGPVSECPVCRDAIDQPSTALMDNMFAVLDPDQPSTPQPDVNHMCTACEEDQEASCYCLQCEEWLCDSCVDAHRRVRVTKDHSISPKSEVKTGCRSPWEQLMMCKQHKQEQLKFFCEKCETLTCRDCQLMDHKEHKYQLLDCAAEQYKARLKGSLALMGEKRTKLAASREEIEQKLQNCKEQKETLQQDILKQADILVKGIRQAVWGVLSNLASFTDAATKRLKKEIDDVSDLIGKFDHCIQFMEDILKDGSSMSLLYSKGNVETKCRKVYHTQVDPQSLKGTLSIVYKHEVNWLLSNLSKIGAIFVNGVRYPPDKNGQGARPNQASGVYQDPRSSGMTTTSPHLQHMANQPIPGQRVPSDWSKFIQTVGKPGSQIPPNMTMSPLGSPAPLPPQLTLPSNRRSSQAGAIVQPWQTPPGMPGHTFPGHFVAGQLLTPQQQQASKPSFTPMRLHHRPATQAPFPGQNDHRSQNMVSPPQYRMGGEASGTPRSTHSTPDPARPASAGGMYDGSVRPDSREASGVLDVKKEKRDHSPDCVIMSSSMKGEIAAAFPSFPKLSKTVLEMQRNLDEVLRAVPMDPSDNLEQISGSRPRTSVDREQLRSPPSAGVLESNHDLGPEGGLPHSPTDQELRENWQGGNSMPGFSLSQADNQGDPNDDYCACCHNGGDVLCCDRCPRVFHLQCHIPELAAVPSGSFVCTICEGDTPVSLDETTSLGKRKSASGLSEADLKVCERILLELFCHPSSVPFQEPVNRVQVPNYYKIITQPKDFTMIKCKLQRSHPNHYQSIKAFLYDLRQVFINCAIYNKTGSEVGKAGKIVRAILETQVERLMPQYLNFVRENPSPCFSALQQQMDPEFSSDDYSQADESVAKRAKMDE